MTHPVWSDPPRPRGYRGRRRRRNLLDTLLDAVCVAANNVALAVTGRASWHTTDPGPAGVTQPPPADSDKDGA